MRRFTTKLAACAVALSVAVAGCSDDGASDPATSDPTTVDAAAEESSTTETTAAPGMADVPARPSDGCADPATDVVTAARVDLEVEGTARWYLLTTPRGAEPDGPLPLVVDLHGLLEGAQVHAAHTRMGEYGQDEGFVTVFPHGTGDPVHWDPSTDPDRRNDDLVYLDAVLDGVAAQRCIDLARVYATGLSNGAMMTSVLACTRSERFAAVAPVDGVLAPEPCDPGRAVPIVATHGTADPILLFNGGRGDLSFLDLESDQTTSTTIATPTTEPTFDLDGPGFPANVAAWADRNGCDPEPTDERVGEAIVHRSYDCPAGADVEFYVVEGGGHSWPGSEFSEGIEAIVGSTTSEIDWNEIAWDFFQRFALAAS